MIVDLPALLFEEDVSDIIRGKDGGADLVFRRNLNPDAYHSFIAQMAEEMRRRKLRQFDLVIAGDLFDLNRTVLWFKDELRPYVSLNHISPALEQKIIEILEAVISEPEVGQALSS